MKVAVIGLWHLGCVTAACLADAGHQVIAYDPDKDNIHQLQLGHSPLFEPGLDDLIAKGVQANRLRFTATPADLQEASLAWITIDTPVDENDIADVPLVMREIAAVFPYLAPSSLVLISSQLPVGSTRTCLEISLAKWRDKHLTFAYSPENLRLGKAIEAFTHPERVIVGLQNASDRMRVQSLLQTFTPNIIWMSVESAEMTKHALNAFLATSIVFINEIAVLCERVGAHADEVEQGLKSEGRIGPKAYLHPGGPIAGGTLARDVNYLAQMGKQHHLSQPFWSALLASNEAHQQWSCRRLVEVLKTLKDKTIATLGLTYKAGTSTLRRSTALSTCQWLTQQGAKVVAFDPAIAELPSPFADFIELKPSLSAAIASADALVIATAWPEFSSLTADEVLKLAKHPRVFDASGFLLKTLGQDQRIHYYSVGRPT